MLYFKNIHSLFSVLAMFWEINDPLIFTIYSRHARHKKHKLGDHPKRRLNIWPRDHVISLSAWIIHRNLYSNIERWNVVGSSVPMGNFSSYCLGIWLNWSDIPYRSSSWRALMSGAWFKWRHVAMVMLFGGGGGIPIQIVTNSLAFPYD